MVNVKGFGAQAGPVLDVYRDFEKTLRRDHEGRNLPPNESVERIAGGLKFELRSIIKDGEYNGLKIKEGQYCAAYQNALIPVLNAAAELSNAVSKNSGYHNEAQASMHKGIVPVDLNKMEYDLIEAVHNWLDAVNYVQNSEETAELRVAHPEIDEIGMPLPMNHAHRRDTTEGLHRITEVLTLANSGYKPMRFITNQEATATLIRSDNQDNGMTMDDFKRLYGLSDGPSGQD